jgi:DNA repair protein REV1
MVSQVNTQEKGYRDQNSTSWYTSQVKTVADDIDNDEGAHFPSTQVVDFNGTGTYIDSPDQPKKSIETDTERQKVVSDDNPSSSAAFEVTSSLEDALNDAAAGENQPSKEVTAERESKPQPPEIITPSKPGDVENLSPQYAASPTSGSHSNTRRRVHETETESPSKKAKVMTAEEHNAILLADPHIRKSSTANPEFIKQYYSESRLHHLSTWKADLKSRFQQMASEKSASQRQPVKRKPGARRYIMHVDFDSFFCAVSLKNAPEYVDKPAVVAHGSGTGSEIASCNYPAREFGVKNGMWMKNALKLCPNIKVLPYDFPAYEEASQGFYEAILDVGGVVQSVSVDEALVDITSLCLPAGGTDGFGVYEGSIWREQEKADDIAQGLRTRIKEKTGCAVSIGIGGNTLLAKIALRKAKPAGQHQIKPEEVLDFIGELTVQNLPGVAYSIGGKLEEIGVKFVKDVRQLNKDRLMTVLGPKTG